MAYGTVLFYCEVVLTDIRGETSTFHCSNSLLSLGYLIMVIFNTFQSFLFRRYILRSFGLQGDPIYVSLILRWSYGLAVRLLLGCKSLTSSWGKDFENNKLQTYSYVVDSAIC